MSVDDEVVYDNGGQCAEGFPSDRQLVERVGKAIGATPKPPASTPFTVISNEGPCCPVPAKGPGVGVAKFVPVGGQATSGCGCTPTDASCCELPKKGTK